MYTKAFEFAGASLWERRYLRDEIIKMNHQKRDKITTKIEEFAMKYSKGSLFDRKETNLEVIDYLTLQELSPKEYSEFACMYADKKS